MKFHFSPVYHVIIWTSNPKISLWANKKCPCWRFDVKSLCLYGTKSCSGPHGIAFSHFIWNFTNNSKLFALQIYFFQAAAAANSSSKHLLNVSITKFLDACCRSTFLSSLCKLSFHPEMEFSFMLKVLLTFCHFVYIAQVLVKLISIDVMIFWFPHYLTLLI